ncbi:MAG: hypothetical protein KAI34_03260 [Candidatus Lokiarchaeota archaeon]|nr:hypothetical protein [Candidatus Lokiarchaeota archaeon]
MWSNLSMRICKTFAKQPFKLVGKKFCPSNLVRPCSYYEDLDLVPEEISAGAKGFATAVFLTIISLSFIWNIAPLLYLSVALLIAYITHGLLMRALPLRYAYERLTIEKYADLILNTMLLAVLAGSTFDAVFFVAKSDFPLVSNDFERILYRINNNEPPEKLLQDYAQKQPSTTLRKHIATLFAINDLNSAIELMKDSTQFEVRTAYDRFTLELDSRLALTIGVSTFMPIFLSLFLIVYGFASAPFILLTVPLHIAMLHVLKNQVLANKVELVG